MHHSRLLQCTQPGVAIGLLLLLVATRVALGLFAAQPVRAREILGVEARRYPRGRLLLLADSADMGRLVAAAARRTESGLPLEVRIPGPDDERREQLHRLIRAYGIERLPVLLTLDAEAHVLRVEPLSPGPRPSE